MTVLRSLLLLHLSATALLLVVLVAVMAYQRAAGAVRSHRALRRTPAVAAMQPAGPSVRDWTIDLRTPASDEQAPVLQRTS